jgi:hypothetical protein
MASAQAFGHEGDRAITVQHEAPNCHTEGVELRSRQLVDASQLIASPLAILALPGEAVADRCLVRRQVAHETTQRRIRAGAVGESTAEKMRAPDLGRWTLLFERDGESDRSGVREKVGELRASRSRSVPSSWTSLCRSPHTALASAYGQS